MKTGENKLDSRRHEKTTLARIQSQSRPRNPQGREAAQPDRVRSRSASQHAQRLEGKRRQGIGYPLREGEQSPGRPRGPRQATRRTLCPDRKTDHPGGLAQKKIWHPTSVETSAGRCWSVPDRI